MGRINKIKRGYLKLVKYILIGLTFIFKPIFDFLNPYIKPIAFKVYAQLSKSTDYLSSYLNRCLIFPINAKIIQPIAKRLGKRWARRVKYGLSCLALIAIITVAALTIINHIVDDSYHLPLSIQAMIGPADTTLMKSQLSYSSKTKTYYIDKSGIGAKSSSAAGIPSGGNSITIGSHSNSAFSLVIPTNIHQGFTTYDNTSGLSFTLTPQFDARSGRIVDNHLVYPMGLSSTKDVYTIKGNGLQENIVYNSAPKGTIKLSYKLTLPSSLQARMMSDGDIGIYSAGSYLFGNISYGSPKDQALVAKARLNAAKTTLVFILPAPQVADSDGNAPSNIQQHTKFSLKGNILTLIASDLGGINGPLSIDPSVIDASASAFQRTGNNESDISFAGSSVSEAGLSGGGLSGNTNSCGVSWCASSTTANTGFSLPVGDYGASAVVYNGYIYFMGGYTFGQIPTVDYAVLNTNGSLGAPTTCTGGTQETDWCESSTSANTGFSLPTATGQATAVVYNGYIYFMGGGNSGVPTVDYVALSANGSLTAPPTCAGTQETDWCESSTTANTGFSLPTATDLGSAVAYNGYIYFMGGYTTTYAPTVDYAVLNANGSLGAPTTCTGGTQETDWCESSTTANTGFSLPTATDAATATVYNGYIYFMGGYTTTYAPTVDYAVLNANGSLGAPATCTGGTQETDWCESSTTANTGFSLPTATEYASAVVYNGYIYYMGGYTGSSVSTDYYAPIYNGGGIGPWSSTTKLPTATYQGSAAVYNGNIYFMGGYTSIDVPTVDYAAISSVGDPTSWTASSATANTGFSLPTSTGNASAVAYNGYIYFMGGQTSSNAAVPTVDYALLNANGSLGAPATCTGGTQETDWCESSTTANTGFSLPTASVVATAVVYNGYIYFMGGEDISGNTLPTVDYALLNANGSLGAPATCTGGTQETDWCESSTTANTGFSLPTATDYASAVVYNGFIYFMGGENVSGTTIPTVDYVALNSNGSLVPPATCTGGTQETDWCESSTTANTGFSLPTATAVPTAVAYNGFIYFIAGQDGGGNALSTVDYAVLNANGSLGAPSTCAGTQETDWCESSTSTSIGFSLPTDTYDAFSVAYNGYIYFMGGYISNYVPTIDYSLINNGGPGTINSWTTTTSLPSATYDAASTIYNNYIYQIAGYVGGVQSSTVDYAQIGPSGALVNTLSSCPSGWTLYSSTWCYNTSSLPFVIIEASAVAYNGYIYLEGGSRPGNSPGTAYYAPINSNGSIGSWTATSAITTYNTSTFTTGNIWYTSTVEWGGYIYALGGETAGSKTIAFQSAVYYALINPNGTLGSWTTTTSLPVANGYASAVAYNGYIYLIGGASFAGNSTAVDYAKVGSSGGLVTSVSSCPSGWTLYSSTWCYNSTSLPNGGVYLASAGAYNGYIYVIGGSPSSTSVSTVDYTSINSNGSLSSSPWTATTSLPTATQEATSVVYNGYIYEIGGYTTAATATVDIGSLNSITRIGFYSELIDMSGSSTEDPSADALLLNGTQTGNPGIGNLGLPGTGGITVNYQFGSNVCPTLSSSSVLTTTPLLIGKPYYMTSFSNGCSSSSDTNFGRWVWLTIKLDDSLTDTFPDSSSNHTTITGLTLYYHPAANGRLRGGGTFSSGANQTLDAPP